MRAQRFECDVCRRFDRNFAVKQLLFDAVDHIFRVQFGFEPFGQRRERFRFGFVSQIELAADFIDGVFRHRKSELRSFAKRDFVDFFDRIDDAVFAHFDVDVAVDVSRALNIGHRRLRRSFEFDRLLGFERRRFPFKTRRKRQTFDETRIDDRRKRRFLVDRQLRLLIRAEDQFHGRKRFDRRFFARYVERIFVDRCVFEVDLESLRSFFEHGVRYLDFGGRIQFDARYRVVGDDEGDLRLFVAAQFERVALFGFLDEPKIGAKAVDGCSRELFAGHVEREIGHVAFERHRFALALALANRHIVDFVAKRSRYRLNGRIGDFNRETRIFSAPRTVDFNVRKRRFVFQIALEICRRRTAEHPRVHIVRATRECPLKHERGRFRFGVFSAR